MNWLLFLLALPISWVLSFVLHEIGHYVAAKKLGGDAEIKYWTFKKILPSLKTLYWGVNKKDVWLVKLFGGMTTALVFIPIGLLMLLINPAIAHAILLAGCVNLFYSFYEMLLLGNIKLNAYMIGHYILYAIVGILYIFNMIMFRW